MAVKHKTVSYAAKTKTKNPRVFIFGKFRNEKTEKTGLFSQFSVFSVFSFRNFPKMKTRGFLVLVFGA